MTEPIPARQPWGRLIHSLAAIIHEIPDLPYAACKGKPAFWDNWVYVGNELEKPSARGERHQIAINLCNQCPELHNCRAQRDAHPDWGDGIYGGQLYEPAKTLRKRQRAQARAAQSRTLTPEQDLERRRANAALPRLTNCQECGQALGPGQTRNCSDLCRNRAAKKRRKAAEAA